jgi:hypothetical protein
VLLYKFLTLGETFEVRSGNNQVRYLILLFSMLH